MASSNKGICYLIGAGPGDIEFALGAVVVQTTNLLCQVSCPRELLRLCILLKVEVVEVGGDLSAVDGVVAWSVVTVI